jgi:hypothetical protein
MRCFLDTNRSDEQVLWKYKFSRKIDIDIALAYI